MSWNMENNQCSQHFITLPNILKLGAQFLE